MLDGNLKELGLARHKGLGKKMGSCVWVHKDYAGDIVPADLFEKAKSHELLDYDFDIVRYDSKENTIALIECKDFDTSDEPVIGKSLLIGDSHVKMTSPSKNPLVYHHKWMFVKDDYNGFSVDDSKERSIQWKSKLGIDKALSSRIGRLEFWLQWTSENGLSSIKKDDIWALAKQELSSRATSMNKIHVPKVFSSVSKIGGWIKGAKNLDLGGGKFDNATELLLNKYGVINVIYDPHNRDRSFNENSLKIIKNGVNTATISNVLNVIKEDKIKAQLIKQAYDALISGGILYVTCYEGSKTGIAKNTGSDQWQENQPLDYYMPLLESVFGNVSKKYGMLYCEK